MKTVLLVMLASVLAWAESLSAGLDFVFALPIALAGLGLARDASTHGDCRGRAAHPARRRVTVTSPPRQSARCGEYQVTKGQRWRAACAGRERDVREVVMCGSIGAKRCSAMQRSHHREHQDGIKKTARSNLLTRP